MTYLEILLRRCRVELHHLLWAFVVFFVVAIVSDYAKSAEIDVYKYKNSETQFIFVHGKIEQGDNNRLQSLINTYAVVRVHFNSPGGSVDEGWTMAKTIRAASLETHVTNKCASACTYAFMGGTKRWMKESAEMGYHPAHIVDFSGDMSLNDIYDLGQYHAMDTMFEYAKYVKYGREYSTLRFIHKVYSEVTYKDMYWATPIELTNAGIVTNTYK